MPDYKNTNRFKKPFTRNGPGRPSFDGPKQMYKAECSSCHKTCEVPFRPNGKKPVFCSACFTRDSERDTRGGSSYQKNDYKNDYAPERSFAPKPAAHQPEDRRIDSLLRQVSAVEGKLDLLIQLFETSRATAPAALPKEKPAAPEAKAKKAVVKKAKPAKK